MKDHKDLVIETLADSEAELLERVASLETDVVAYSQLAIAAIHTLLDLTGAHNRLRAQHQHVIAEYRVYRERTMRQAVAA